MEGSAQHRAVDPSEADITEKSEFTAFGDVDLCLWREMRLDCFKPADRASRWSGRATPHPHNLHGPR
jgi:hypothetical protein